VGKSMIGDFSYFGVVLAAFTFLFRHFYDIAEAFKQKGRN
jgi:hypothetical protein